MAGKYPERREKAAKWQPLMIGRKFHTCIRVYKQDNWRIMANTPYCRLTKQNA